MSLFLRINMDVGMDGELNFEPETVLTSVIFYWGAFNPNYPFDDRGHRVVSEAKQIEFRDIPCKDINWVLTEMRKLHWNGE